MKFFSNHPKLSILALILIVSIPLILALVKPKAKTNNTNVSTTQPPQPTRIYSLQKVIIGKTTDSQIERLPNVLDKKKLPNNDVLYSLSSPVPKSRPNQIVTQGGVAVYERVITEEEDPTSQTYAKISQYQSGYGNPEKIIKGSKYYGDFMETYIYSALGFVLIGNPNTDEVYEVQVFKPMDVASYLQKYGQDIDINPAPQGP